MWFLIAVPVSGTSRDLQAGQPHHSAATCLMRSRCLSAHHPFGLTQNSLAVRGWGIPLCPGRGR